MDSGAEAIKIVCEYIPWGPMSVTVFVNGDDRHLGVFMWLAG